MRPAAGHRADGQRHHTQPIKSFYDLLVGRTLTEQEQERLDRCFHVATGGTGSGPH
ncbi:hypothetical protein [Micromonospora sp. NPDC126480]|uniref:hypothetical protein n=1 Tax=Micromonospora sp. NPDC126480 TaxID=3155312 RepID=UPI00332B1AEC